MSQSQPAADNDGRGTVQTFALDTDIGTDVDDLLALAMIFGSPELALSAVTTVYGDVELRARIVAKAFAAAGVTPPPIAPGLSETASGRPVWWPGHEGATISDLDEQTYAFSRTAIEELAATETVAAIAPMTNMGAAIAVPGHQIKHVVIMGGEFQRGIVEHNIRCDVAAAHALFDSGVNVLAVGLDQTERVRLGHEELNRIEASGRLGELISGEMKRFWSFAEQDYNVPHDPMAVLTLARPDLFEVTKGTITVDTAGETEGVTRFTAGDGPHAIVTDMDVPAVAREITERILAAAGIVSSGAHS